MNYIREAITQQHIGEETIALRRHLHAHPDLSEQEFPTMELVWIPKNSLSSTALTFRCGGYSIREECGRKWRRRAD